MKKSTLEIWVGLFIVLAILSLSLLAFRVSGLGNQLDRKSFTVTAIFDNIGGLKVRAPVTISGVKVGEVSRIQLDSKTFAAIVTLKIFSANASIPVDTGASIYTAGLIGANYISLSPGYSESFLQEGSVITDTHPALVLEKLIGQFLFNMNKKS